MITIDNLSLVAQQPFQITEQDKAIFKLRALLHKTCYASFPIDKNKTFVVVDKNNTGMIVNKDLTHVEKKIEVTVTRQSSGDFSVMLKIRDYDGKTKGAFESNLYNVDVAIKHKSPTSKAIKGTFARLNSPEYGATVTLRLQNEGEYEILIGDKAKSA